MSDHYQPTTKDEFDMRMAALRSDALTIETLCKLRPDHAREWASTFHVLSQMFSEMAEKANKKEVA